MLGGEPAAEPAGAPKKNAKLRAGVHAVLAAYRMHQAYVSNNAEPKKKHIHQNSKLGQAQRLLTFAKVLNPRLGEESPPSTRVHADVYYAFGEICANVAARTYTPATTDEEMAAMAMMQGLGF
eukprot:SAG22_NODE_5783_length_953_cov_1.067916_1_plen_123_part_00